MLGTVPPFELTSQAGLRWSSATLDGKPYVANFVFTRCPTICPTFTAKMASIQKKTGDGLNLVSFSVDPETDTPAVLRAYGERFNARFSSWSFLTGDLMQIYDTVVGGFKVAMDNPKIDPSRKAPVVTPDKDTMTMDLMEITHGEHFVLIDQIGQIRAYMQAHNDEQINQIVKTLGILANTNPLKVAPQPNAISR